MTDLDMRAVPESAAADSAALAGWAEELVDRARAEGVELIGENGLSAGMVRQVPRRGLEAGDG